LRRVPCAGRPPGLAFEHYDELGRYRDTENGKPIDSTGELTDSDVAGPFEDGLELAGMLAESDEVGACVVRQYFRFALGPEAQTRAPSWTAKKRSSEPRRT
jgi:hypothetical protein